MTRKYDHEEHQGHKDKILEKAGYASTTKRGHRADSAICFYCFSFCVFRVLDGLFFIGVVGRIPSGALRSRLQVLRAQ